MDNVTHTLVGVALGHCARTRDPSLRKALVWAAALGSNLPDFDFLINPFVGGGKLAYLLHHRGHTHTLILAPLLALVTTAAALKVSKAGRSRFAPVYAMALLAGAIHIGMDGFNDYGIHPFWPFDNRWYYGDFVFIIEPLLLFALIPFAFFRTPAAWAKWGLAVIGAGLAGLVWFGPFMSWPVALFATAWAALHFALQRRSPSLKVLGAALACVLLVFFGTSKAVRAKVAREILAKDPGESSVQLITTPAPSNPVCWRAIYVGRDGDGNPVLRLGLVSLIPQVLKPGECVVRSIIDPTLPLRPVDGGARDASIHWVGEHRSSAGELRELASANCWIDQFLRFARAPFWLKLQDATVVGDLRYDREPGLGFAEAMLRGGEPCLKRVPPWVPPAAAAFGHVGGQDAQSQ